MLAMCMAAGVETDYTILVEKRYFRSFWLSRQSQMYARKLLALDPPVYDAHLTLGMVEYVVGSMNAFFRLFVHFDQIKGSRQQGAEHLKLVAEHGRGSGFFVSSDGYLLTNAHVIANAVRVAAKAAGGGMEREVEATLRSIAARRAV